jgi:hypothetical protein
MSEVQLEADYAQPVDLTRFYNVARIAIAAIALAAAVWLAFENYDKARGWTEAIFQARLEARAAVQERDQAIAERNAAIVELEGLRADKQVSGLGGAGLARVDGYLADIEKRTDELRGAAATGAQLPPERLLAQLTSIREIAGEAREYVRASSGEGGEDADPGKGASPLRGKAPAPDATPTLRPSGWNPAEAPARLIPASLNGAAAAPPVPPPLAEGVPGLSLAQTKLYVVLSMLGVLGLTFVIAVIAVFTTRNARKHTFATDTIKTLLGFFIGVVTAFMGAPG